MNTEIEQALENVSAVDLVNALQSGDVSVDDILGADETSSMDLSNYSEDELRHALTDIDSQESTEKVASSEDGEYWEAAGRLMARGYSEELQKNAQENVAMDIDLNELSPEQIVELGYDLVGEMDKEASGEADLNNLSPEEIVALGYELAGDMDKEASDGVDLNQLSVDEFIELAAHLEGEMGKEASEDGVDLNQLSVDEFIELAAHLEGEMGKEASEEGIDLNQLSVDEFVELAAHLEGEMSKEAGPRMQAARAVAGRAGRGALDIVSGGRLRRNVPAWLKHRKNIKTIQAGGSEGTLRDRAIASEKGMKRSRALGAARGAAEVSAMPAGLAAFLAAKRKGKKSARKA